MDTLEKFSRWSDRHHTHVSRHISILSRQAESLRLYVELIKNRPVDSVEFLVEIMKIHSEIIILLDELSETNLDFIQDCDDFKDVIDSIKQVVLKVAEK